MKRLPILLLLSLGLCGCHSDGVGSREGEAPVASINYGKYVNIGGVNPASASHVTDLLDAHGIRNLVYGSVVYCVEVEPSAAAKARALLKADSEKRGYYFDPA